MTQPSHPHRVRLHGGRNTHAARDLNGGDHITACDYFLPTEARNHWLDPAEPVTCPACKRALAREDTP
ncbi:MAG: hypothetical protein K0R62_3808 [Nonomuraea muscovyensis]|jgi:hypothetical protein|nr:hypothetical protein [Nonomuraea muscovyensis]